MGDVSPPCREDDMPYEFTERGRAMHDQVAGFMADHIYPNEAEYHEELEQVGPSGYPPILDKLKAAARERGLWKPVPAPSGSTRTWDEALQPRLRTRLRGARQGRLRLRGAQLRRPRYRKHGGPQPLRLRVGQAGLADTAAGGRDQICLLHDRTRCRLL